MTLESSETNMLHIKFNRFEIHLFYNLCISCHFKVKVLVQVFDFKQIMPSYLSVLGVTMLGVSVARVHLACRNNLVMCQGRPPYRIRLGSVFCPGLVALANRLSSSARCSHDLT